MMLLYFLKPNKGPLWKKMAFLRGGDPKKFFFCIKSVKKSSHGFEMSNYGPQQLPTYN